jgi:hypothetical protein
MSGSYKYRSLSKHKQAKIKKKHPNFYYFSPAACFIIRAEINKLETKKSYKESMNQKLVL